MMRPALLSLCLLSACGSGSGTGDLFIEATLTGKPDSTRVEVVVKKNGARVVGANVFVDNREGTDGKNLEGTGKENAADDDRDAFRYEGTFRGYLRAATLQVVSGESGLEAELDGPLPHEITRPPDNAIVHAADGEVLDVEWTTPDRANRVVIRGVGTDGDEQDLIEVDQDLGQASIALSVLRKGDQTLAVVRENGLRLSGAVSGSILRVSYRVDNRFTLER